MEKKVDRCPTAKLEHMYQQLDTRKTGTKRTQPAITDPLIQEFLAYLQFERGLADNTITSYRQDLCQFQNFLEEHEIIPVEVTTASIRDFLSSLGGAEGLPAGATIARKISVLRSFYKYLCREKIADINPVLPVKSPRQGHRLPTVLNLAEVRRLLVQPSGGSPGAIRDTAILELLYCSGLRVSELCLLYTSDA